jgi:hypothetical protein
VNGDTRRLLQVENDRVVGFRPGLAFVLAYAFWNSSAKLTSVRLPEEFLTGESPSWLETTAFGSDCIRHAFRLGVGQLQSRVWWSLNVERNW